MPRLFTGLEIPPDIGLALALKRGGLPGARWIDPENYHITLRFIGEVDRRTAEEAAGVLERFLRTAPIRVTLTHFGVFGGNKPRALYAGLAENGALGRLQAGQERALQQIGLPPDGRKFIPHVTLARLKGVSAGDAARFMAEAARFAPLGFTAGRFVLYSSRDSTGGGPYVIEQAYPLTG